MSDSNKPRGHLGARDNKTGQFVPRTELKRRPASTTGEIVPNPGNGDTGRYDKPKRPNK